MIAAQTTRPEEGRTLPKDHDVADLPEWLSIAARKSIGLMHGTLEVHFGNGKAKRIVRIESELIP